MSEREKNAAEKLAEALKLMPKAEQARICGIAEGVEIMAKKLGLSATDDLSPAEKEAEQKGA